MYLLREDCEIKSLPKNVKQLKHGKVRMEAVLQTVGDLNRNKRKYRKSTIQESIDMELDRIKSKEFLGELDHPISSKPQRQMQVLYKEASHAILELGWEGDLLVGVLETLSYGNGLKLAALVSKDKIPVGFSYRGMGDLRQISEGHEVVGPLKTITWDSVSFPSHSRAKLRSFTESTDYSKNKKHNIYTPVKMNDSITKPILESFDIHNIITEKNGMICTSEGVCFIPSAFDAMVENHKKRINDKVSKYFGK